MKLKYISGCLALTALSFLMGACDDAEYSVIDNGVYLAEAAPLNAFNQQLETKLIDDVNVEQTLTVRLVQAIDQDVKVTLGVDSIMLAQYNEAHATNYKVLPKEFMELSETEVVIPAGQSAAPSVTLVIKPYTNPNNESYAIPVKITSVSGPTAITGSADRLLFLLTSPNKQKSVILRGSNQTTVNFKAPIPASAWTFEFWLKVNNKSGRPTDPWEGDPQRAKRALIFVDNASPVQLGGSESVLLRYWADGVKKIAPTLQCQLDGVYFDSSEFWYPDTWYHICYTYNGSEMILYKDGAKNSSKEVSKNFDFRNMTFCGNVTGTMEVEFAQIRLWNKCLTPNAIQDGMSRKLPSDSDGLVGYWSCDEGTGNVLKDITANGNDITLNGSPVWSTTTYNFAHPNDK